MRITLVGLRNMRNQLKQYPELMMSKSLSIQKQNGMATLIFSLVVLFTLTITTIFSARVGLLNEKMSSNDFRAKESLMAADSGMDMAIAAVQEDGDTSNSPYRGFVGDPLAGNGVKSYSVEATVVSTSPIQVIKIVATGCVSADTTKPCGIDATAAAGTPVATDLESVSVITQHMALITVLGESPAAPLVLAGTISPVGSYQIVGKDGGTIECGTGTLDGKPILCPGLLSIWSDDSIKSGGGNAFSGSAATCGLDYFLYRWALDSIDDKYGLDSDVPMCATDSVTSSLGLDKDCECSNGPSGKDSLGPYVVRTNNMGDSVDISDKVSTDIVAPPVVDEPVANFPSDLFAYVFDGIPRASYQVLKDAADQNGKLLPDCSTIDHTSKGLYWIEGDCDLGGVVGSPENPVVIVAENGVINTQGTEGFGLLFGFDQDGSGTAAYVGNGISYWYGGIIVDGAGEIAAGFTRLIFSEGVFTNLNKQADLMTLAVVPGTWKDF